MAGPLVVGYDGSEGARAAMAEALRLAAALSAEVVVVFVYHAGAVGGETGGLLEALRERGSDVVAQALDMARAAGVEARAELVNDRPADGLAGVAAEEGAQMIVIGSYGERSLKAVVLGSTPHRLVHLTETPVLIVSGARS